MKKLIVVGIVLGTLLGSLLGVTLAMVALPAHAAVNPPTVYGHRCREYDTRTNEDTMAALEYDHAHHVGCEADVWLTSDNVPIVIHDQTPRRTITPASIKAAGVTATTRWIDMTYAQTQKLWTKGHQRIPSLHRFIRYAVIKHVPTKIEVKWGLPNPAYYMRLARSFGNYRYITFYSTPHLGTCSLSVLDSIKAVGFSTGVKSEPSCPNVDYGKYRYAALSKGQITKSFVKHLHSLGVAVGNKDDQASASLRGFVDAGVDFVIAPHPVAARSVVAGAASRQGVAHGGAAGGTVRSNSPIGTTGGSVFPPARG